MFKPVFIEATTIDDCWHQLLYQAKEKGRRYKITSGSYEGQERLALDFVGRGKPVIKLDKMGLGGCGPGWWGDRLVPDTLWGLSIRPACEIHDYMYGTGRTWDDKRLADKVFLQNMGSIITVKSRSRLLRALRLRRARCYYRAVSDFGGINFHATEVPS